MKIEGLLGQKIGMTRVFKEDGRSIAVTVVTIPSNTVFAKKESSVVLGIANKRQNKNINKRFKVRKEFKVSEDLENVEIGKNIDISALPEDIKHCSISAKSKGKGFAGVIKRYNFSRGPETHGSRHHRKPGSVGACVKPGRVHKGKKLPGRMGNERVSLREVEVVDVDKENNTIAFKGSLPGSNKGFIEIYFA